MQDFEATKVIKQDRMFFYLTFYKKQIKLETRCFIVDAIETLEKLKPELTVLERSLFEEHPQFRHFFHVKKTQTTKSRKCGFFCCGLPITRSEKKCGSFSMPITLKMKRMIQKLAIQLAITFSNTKNEDVNSHEIKFIK